jgi:hypothetical protein
VSVAEADAALSGPAALIPETIETFRAETERYARV